MSELLIGCDPELFVFNNKIKSFVSAHNILPGSKEEPMKVKYGAIQVDGVAGEFNIDPVTNVEDFLHHVSSVRGTMEALVKKQNPDYELRPMPFVAFNKSYFDKLPANVKELGCNPDYNAYTNSENISPYTSQPVRTGAGHFHFGWTEKAYPYDSSHLFDCISLVKQLDAVYFVPSLLWDRFFDRRSMYGALGAFRPKSYGVEYRVPSNRWLMDNSIGAWLFQSFSHAVSLIDDEVTLFDHEVVQQYLMNGVNLSKAEVLDYCEWLEEYDFPKIPEFIKTLWVEK